MSYLEIKEIKKSYTTGGQTVRAADGMTLSAEKGEFVVIVGPSGAGKTTLLNIIGGMDRCDSGSIVLDCALKEASLGNALMNDHMTGEFPVLKPGANAVSWSGTVTKVEIKPNWRFL